jgi:type I restriction enzyme S subunit
VKAGWEVKALGSLLEVKNGYAFDSKKFTPDAGTPLIRIRDIKEGKGTAINYNGEYNEEFICKQGDFLIGMDGEFGCYEWKGDPSLLNQRVCRLENFDSGLMSRFLFYGINKYLKEIEAVTGYTTVKHLSSKTIKTIEFPLPPLAEQKRIVSILDEAFEGLDRARENAEANLKNASDLRQSLLQKAFAGELT